DLRMPARVGAITGRWSHLSADTVEELHAFAASIGLRRDWFQTCKHNRACRPATRCVHWHYDVTDSARTRAIAAGAVPIELRQWRHIIHTRRTAVTVHSGAPQ